MTANDERSASVQATHTAFAILKRMRDREGVTVTQLAEELDLAKSTVHKHLQSLLDEGYLHKDGGVYHIGLRFLDFGILARNRDTLYRVAKPKVEELAETTGEKAWLITEDHGQAIHVYGASGEHPVRTWAREGKLTYLHQTAAGKAILANFPDERVRDVVENHGLPERTEDTITDFDALREELEAIRNRGYAFNRGETVHGLCAVGAPVCDESGVALGAISISGPANRVKGDVLESELPDLLLGATNEIEINLAHA